MARETCKAGAIESLLKSSPKHHLKPNSIFLQVLKELRGGFRRIGVTEIRSGNPLGDDDCSSLREVRKLGFPYRCIRQGCAYALAIDDDGGLRSGAWRGCLGQHSLKVTAPEASRYLVCRV